MAAAVITMLAAGCGGGGGGGTTTTGAVTGWIVDLAEGVGIGNMVVVIGGRQGTSTTPNGSFTVSGIPPGVYDVTVIPTESFTTVGAAPVVAVTANQTSVIGTILVVNPAWVPPTPP